MKSPGEIFLWIGILALSVGCTGSDSNFAILSKKNIQCPIGSNLRYLPWGESGLQAVCILEHGPFMIAEHGHIKIVGQNESGKKVGEWRWFDSSGKVVRTEQHDAAKR